MGRGSFDKIPKEAEHNNAEVDHYLNSNHREHMNIFYKIPKEAEHNTRRSNAEVDHHLNRNHREHMSIFNTIQCSEVYYHVTYIGL